MIGRTITRKADRASFTIAGYDEAQATYTLAPVEFGPNVAVTADKLCAEFSGLRNLSPLGATDEVIGWKQIGAAFERAARRERRGTDGVLTPEEVLSGRARERAEQIAADEDALADYAVGLLPVSKEVAAVLDAVLEERAAEADKPRRRSKPNPDDTTLTTADARRLGHK
jgi:hypothetical protein